MKSKCIYISLAIATVALSTYSCKKPKDNVPNSPQISSNLQNDSLNQVVQQTVTDSASQVTEKPEKKKIPLPFRLGKVLKPIKEFDSVKDCYDSMELTDSLKKRIRIFVDREPNFIIYEIQKFTSQLDNVNMDIQSLLCDEYIFTESDKDALYKYLCANTCLYNCAGSRYRMNLHSNEWPF